MRKCAICVALLSMLVVLSLSGASQIEIPGLILTDMQLISQESLPHWTPLWTGPIQAATIAAWFAEHGYPALMQDYNGDGIIDELDTIELANDFGEGPMRTETPRGTTDVFLVVAFANYIAERYPDEFVLKIYDQGFPQEFQAQGFGPFAPDAIPGIVLELMGEPTLDGYIHELSTGEGVIVGIEEDAERNRYFSGRSFLYEQTPAGYTPVDFAWAKEDQWADGHQGQVLQTIGRMAEWFEIEFLNRWVPVECMLALSPLVEREPEPQEHACPDNAIAYHSTSNFLGDYGEVVVEECVVREGDADIYIWTVTNISYSVDGCGFCFFMIPNADGLPILGHAEGAGWVFTSTPASWVWWLPLGSCGIQPGDSAVFMVVVPGPTTDNWIAGGVGRCFPMGTPVPARLHVVETTGPGEASDDCPDLAIRVLDESCVFDTLSGMYEFMVWFDVINVGSAPVTSSFDVSLTGTSHPGSDLTTVTVPPMLPPGGIISLTMSFTTPPDATGGAPCPLWYELIADSGYVIPECDEHNNVVIDDICCLGEPDDDPGDDPGGDPDCPDLIVEIDAIDCELDRKNGVYILTVDATVTNIGTATVTDAIYVQASCDRGSDTEVILADLDPGDTASEELVITFSVNEPGCPIPVTVTVDHPNFITECNEGNNTDTDDACCD